MQPMPISDGSQGQGNATGTVPAAPVDLAARLTPLICSREFDHHVRGRSGTPLTGHERSRFVVVRAGSSAQVGRANVNPDDFTDPGDEGDEGV